MVIVPAVIIKSAWRGLERGISPKRSKSNREPIKAANSIKQQAVPNSNGHRRRKPRPVVEVINRRQNDVF